MSFTKKPIKSTHMLSTISSFIAHVVPSATLPPQKLSLNTATHYTYRPKLPQPFTDRPSNSARLLQFVADIGGGQHQTTPSGVLVAENGSTQRYAALDLPESRFPPPETRVAARKCM